MVSWSSSLRRLVACFAFDLLLENRWMKACSSVAWLEDFLMEFPGTLIVVSHDRWFLNNICTHIVDIDYNQVKLYVGNYDFWYESSKIMQALMNDQKKRREDKIRELQAFIQRFSSNKSKAKQATSRRKLLAQ